MEIQNVGFSSLAFFDDDDDDDSTHSVVMPQYVVCQSVTFGYRDNIGWNTSKIISRPISLRFMLRLTPTSGRSGPKRTPPKLRSVE